MSTVSVHRGLVGQRLLGQLPADDLAAIEACGHIERYEPEAALAREDEVADRFFVIEEGRVALEMHAPGGPLLIETRGPGDLIGWSWRFEPHHWSVDIVALEATTVITVETDELVDRCMSDAGFRYRITEVFAMVLRDRLHATRLRLLDLYRSGDGR